MKQIEKLLFHTELEQIYFDRKLDESEHPISQHFDQASFFECFRLRRITRKLKLLKCKIPFPLPQMSS